MNPWIIIGWLLLAIIVGGIASLIVSWELEARKTRKPKPAKTAPRSAPQRYDATRNARPGKETIYVHGRTSRGDYLLSFDPKAPPWVEAASLWQQRVRREGLTITKEQL
jgi:hypothetical protein